MASRTADARSLAQHVNTGSFMLYNVADLSDTNSSSGETINMITVPVPCFVYQVAVQVQTIEDSTLTFTVGDGGDSDGWITTVDAETLGYTSANGAYAIQTAGPKFYESSDSIDFFMSANVGDTAIIRLWVMYNQLMTL